MAVQDDLEKVWSKVKDTASLKSKGITFATFDKNVLKENEDFKRKSYADKIKDIDGVINTLKGRGSSNGNMFAQDSPLYNALLIFSLYNLETQIMVNEIKNINVKIDDNTAIIAKLNDEIKSLQKQLGDKTTASSASEKSLNAALQEKEAEIARKQAEIKNLQEEKAKTTESQENSLKQLVETLQDIALAKST